MRYRAICFDFDYTLADATDSIVAGFQYGFTQLGWPAPHRETVRGTIGLLLEDAYTLLTGDSDPENRARFRPLFLEVAKPRQREETVLLPGAAALLTALHARGVKLGIVSTKRSDTIEYVMARLQLDHALQFVIGSGEVMRPKPDPQGLHMALERLGVAREELLFVGDTVIDAGAAQNAGVDFAAVCTGTTAAAAFATWPNIGVCPDLWSLGTMLGVPLDGPDAKASTFPAT